MRTLAGCCYRVVINGSRHQCLPRHIVVRFHWRPAGGHHVCLAMSLSDFIGNGSMGLTFDPGFTDTCVASAHT